MNTNSASRRTLSLATGVLIAGISVLSGCAVVPYPPLPPLPRVHIGGVVIAPPVIVLPGRGYDRDRQGRNGRHHRNDHNDRHDDDRGRGHSHRY